ncbi:ThiF family adenylyltransferase [Glaesserella parasuis]|nr:ThiF family adenylyltransferase [Glaesserella parasuis]
MEGEYKLKADVTIYHDTPYTKVLFGSTYIEILDDDQYYFSILEKRRWKLENLPDELVDVLKEYNLFVKTYIHEYENTELEKNIYLIESLIDSKSHKTPIDIQKQLSSTKILLLGVGGIGCIVLDNLLRLGIRDFFIIDSDMVEVSNLNRQILFVKEDIGFYKVEIIKNKVLAMYDGVRVNYSTEYVDNVNYLSDICINYSPDFIVNALDTPRNIEGVIFDISKKLSIPSISCGVGVHSGFWGPIYPFAKYYEIEKEFRNLNVKPIKGSLPTTNMIIGSMVSHDIFKFFINPKDKNLYSRKFFNFQTYTCEVI